MEPRVVRLSDPYEAAADKLDPMEVSGQPDEQSGYKALQVMGSIKEKGFTEDSNSKAESISFPAVTVLPFPVARHRSEGPHWTPLPLRNDASAMETVELEDDEVMNPAAAAALAKPLIPKKRPQLLFPKARQVGSKSTESRKVAPSIVEVTETSEVERTMVASVDAGKRSASPEDSMAEAEKSFANAGNYVVNPVTPMVQPRVSESESIDAENRQRISGMSQEEIAEAREDLQGKLNPKLLEMLKKRGARKETAAAARSSSDGPLEVDVSPAAAVPNEAPKSVVAEMKSDSPSSAWTERVEAVKLMKFGLDGKLMQAAAESEELVTFQSAAERDFLRSGGDPAAWGYTIKQAAELSRSTVSGQRVLGLQLIASVLHHAANSLLLNEVQEGVDWQAVWAYALGPHPEITMALRLALDDVHATVLTACGKAIQALLSCLQNDAYFEMREAAWPYQPLHYTAPVFRKLINQQQGFIGGGHWKYNVKSSEVIGRLSKENEEGTVGADAAVAERDVAAGLICMGILPRIRYILEVEKLASTDETLLSILVAFARHSPAAADAVMKCPRLIEAVAQRFLLEDDSPAPQAQPARTRAIQLLKVLSQASKSNCIYFAKLGVLQVAHGDLFVPHSFKGHSSAVEALQLWSVCIYHDLGTLLFSDFYPAISSWLLPPTQTELLGNDAKESLLLAKESYKALELLARKLPILRVQNQCDAQPLERTWAWSMVVPLIESSTKWLQPWTMDALTKELQEGSRMRNPKSFAGALAAVLHFLATICERVLVGAEMEPDRKWLPEFVPVIGLSLVSSRLLGSFNLEQTAYPGVRLRYTSCLHGTVRLGFAVDRLLNRARTVRPADGILSDEERVLHSGIIRSGQDELGRLLSFMRHELVRSREVLPVTEIKDRGGPAPGVGLGWGAAGGGFWSPQFLLAQTYARTALKLATVIDGTTEDSFSTGLAVAAVADDPAVVAEAISEVMVPRSGWQSVLETASRTVSRLGKSGTVTLPESDELRLCLVEHYSKTWLRRKSKSKKQPDGQTLPTIHEGSDEQAEHGTDNEEQELMMEMAGSRLPLPCQWFLSPLHFSSEDEAEVRTVVMAGLVQLLCVEGLPEGLGFAGVSISRKVHALSSVFLAGDVFLERDVSNIIGVLQDVYGNQLGNEGSVLDFQAHVDAEYVLFAENLAVHFASASYADTNFGRQLGFYFRQQLPAALRIAVWRVLAEARAMELLPTLEQCPGSSDAYLHPVETRMEVLELYVSSWTSGVLDRAFSRRALPFRLALHHLGEFMFKRDDEAMVGKKLARSIIIRTSIRNNPQAKGMLKELYNYLPGQSDVFLTNACEGDLGLLSALKW